MSIVAPAASAGRARMAAFLWCPISGKDGRCQQKSKVVSLQRQPDERCLVPQ